MTSQGVDRRSGRARTLARVVGVLSVAAILGGAGVADAVPPQELVRQLTDVTGGELGAGETDARSALARLDDEDGIELYVVVVDSTDGQDLVEWADETALISGLGDEDPLLALATEDGDYALSVGQDFVLDDDEIQQVTDAMETPFDSGDYAGAVVAAADEMRSLAGGGVAGGGFALGWLVWGVALLGILGLVGFFWLRSRRPRAAPQNGPGPWAAPATDAPPVPVEELNREANRMLVATDEDVRGAERELAFAQAEFGDAAVEQFAQALGQAKASVVEGFSLRQRLDDSEPETEAQQRELLQRVMALCTASRDALTSQAEAFAQLRDLAGRVPELLATLTARGDAVEQGLPRARTRLADLAARFSPAAVEAVAHVPAQAAERLTRVRALLSEVSRQPSPASVPPSAAVPAAHPAVALRSAEEDLKQAEEMLAAVDRVSGELHEAGRQLPRAISALTADVQAMPDSAQPAAPGLAEALASAEAALGYAEANGRVDPMGSLTRLTESDAALDRVTATVRAAAEQAARARAALPEAISTAQARVAAAEDIITVNRGQVGGTARTRASEASRVLAEAIATASIDPVASLGAARRALELALAAEQTARADISGGRWAAPGGSAGYGDRDRDSGGGILDAIFGGGWSSGGGGWPSGGRGGWSGGGGGWSGSSSRRSGSSRRSSSSRSSSRRSVSRSSSRRSSRRR